MKLITRIFDHSTRNLKSILYTNCALYSGSKYRSAHIDGGNKGEKALPPEPTQCCSTGCPNCVWIKYAQELAQMYDDGDVLARKKITEKVKDQKLRTFIFTQLGMKEEESRR